MKQIFVLLGLIFLTQFAKAQVVINEGSNKNYSSIADEEGDFDDWIELFNSGSTAVDLYNYSLTDTTSLPTQWTFPHFVLQPGAFEVIYCSGKNYMATAPFTNVLNTGTFTPTNGWNTHTLSTPFFWDGVSNVIVNMCSYSSTGYTVNSIFNQSATSFNSCIYAYQDGSPASCGFPSGTAVMQRPNVQFDGHIIGTGTIQNSNTGYPAPYGNWYWGARNQMLFRASELQAAGMTAGYINTLSFDVTNAGPATYDYIDISMNATSVSTMTTSFAPPGGYNYHTNFKLSSSGETVSLYSPTLSQISSLYVNASSYDVSIGRLPNASSNITSFEPATPGASNNASISLNGTALIPAFSVSPGFFGVPFYVSIWNFNPAGSTIYYTMDGSDPDTSSLQFTGSPIYIFQSTPLKARAFIPGKIPSPIAAATYFLNVSHVTPVLSVITDPTNLYGPTGNFDHPNSDWLKAAYTEFFDSNPSHTVRFSQHAGMIQDGGAGGSRTAPQHSFRLELANSLVGESTVNYALIPDKPTRTHYSNLYLRNGSNQYLRLPYKDAAQVKMMCKETNNYYSAWRPVSVYMNGQYFGLYEMREKFDAEFFKENEGATKSLTDVYSMSFFYGSVLRNVCGAPADTFFARYNQFNLLNTNDPLYWNKADSVFDLTYYTDYIIAESWMANTDWPDNNIKIYRSDKTNYRYRFCVVDQELGLSPHGWTDCTFDHIHYMLTQSTSNPYINVWLKSMQNQQFKTYFINRYADVMNTSYDTSRLRSINNDMFNQTVTEMPNEFMKWGDPSTVPVQMNNFYTNYLSLDTQLVCRTSEVRNTIQSNLNLPQQVNITLDVYPAGAGTIHISTITPDSYPWQGVYFDGVPVKIETFANTGYTFLNWDVNAVISNVLNPVFLDTLTSNLIFKANFTAIPDFVPTVEEFNANFTLYPSPAHEFVMLRCENSSISTDASYEIRSMTGTHTIIGLLNTSNRDTKININELTPGMYLFTVIDRNGLRKQMKFVKM